MGHCVIYLTTIAHVARSLCCHNIFTAGDGYVPMALSRASVVYGVIARPAVAFIAHSAALGVDEAVENYYSHAIRYRGTANWPGVAANRSFLVVFEN